VQVPQTPLFLEKTEVCKKYFYLLLSLSFAIFTGEQLVPVRLSQLLKQASHPAEQDGFSVCGLQDLVVYRDGATNNGIGGHTSGRKNWIF